MGPVDRSACLSDGMSVIGFENPKASTNAAETIRKFRRNRDCIEIRDDLPPTWLTEAKVGAISDEFDILLRPGQSWSVRSVNS